MLRFIVRRDGCDSSGRRWEDMETLDVDVPELERRLLSGGYGGEGWDQTHLVGVEVRAARETENAE